MKCGVRRSGKHSPNSFQIASTRGESRLYPKQEAESADYKQQSSNFTLNPPNSTLISLHIFSKFFHNARVFVHDYSLFLKYESTFLDINGSALPNSVKLNRSPPSRSGYSNVVPDRKPVERRGQSPKQRSSLMKNFFKVFGFIAFATINCPRITLYFIKKTVYQALALP